MEQGIQLQGERFARYEAKLESIILLMTQTQERITRQEEKLSSLVARVDKLNSIESSFYTMRREISKELADRTLEITNRLIKVERVVWLVCGVFTIIVAPVLAWAAVKLFETFIR